MTNTDRLAQALRDLFGESIAWGAAYCPAIPKKQWGEMRDSQAKNFADRYAALASLATAAVEGDAAKVAIAARNAYLEQHSSGDAVAAMQAALAAAFPALTAQVAALTAQCEGLRKDAANKASERIERIVAGQYFFRKQRGDSMATSMLSKLLDDIAKERSAIAAGNGEGE